MRLRHRYRVSASAWHGDLVALKKTYVGQLAVATDMEKCHTLY